MDELSNKLENLSISSKPSSKFAGKKPNLNWKAVSRESLIEANNFLPVPPIEESAKRYGDNIPTYLFEQHSEKWHAFRNERLTASNLGAALGFFESKNAKVLQLKPVYVNHAKLVQMAQFLGKSSDKAFEFSEAAKTSMEWGTLHEANGISTFLAQFPDCYVKETGLWSLDAATLPEECKNKASPFHVPFEDLPAIGASPDGLVCKKLNNAARAYFDSGEEVVSLLEVKCPCPFKLQGPIYRYRQEKPHAHIPFYYMPQIQCQMMVTGTKHCYYTCWTATSGTHIFKVDYNDRYCAKMLYFVALFYKEYVKKAIEPPANMFHERQDYLQFLQDTMDIATSAQLVHNVKNSIVSKLVVPMFLDEDAGNGEEQEQENNDKKTKKKTKKKTRNQEEEAAAQ